MTTFDARFLPDTSALETLRPLISALDGTQDVDALLVALGRLTALTLTVNQTMNLTAVREPGAFVVRHLEDSLQAALAVEQSLGVNAFAAARSAGRGVLDLGAGSGIPGLVWALLWPAVSVTLVESVGKKTAFLTEAATELNLTNIMILNGRADDLGHDPEHREQYGWVTARAFAAWSTLLELGWPWVRMGGLLTAIKAAVLSDEEAAGFAAAAPHVAAPLPDAWARATYARSDGADGAVWSGVKTGTTPARYPRGNNQPRRRPLA